MSKHQLPLIFMSDYDYIAEMIILIAEAWSNLLRSLTNKTNMFIGSILWKLIAEDNRIRYIITGQPLSRCQFCKLL